MNDLIAWQEQNAKFLDAALTWLRLRLQEHIEGGPKPPLASGAVSAAPSAATSPSSLFDWMQPKDAEPVDAAAAVVESEVERAARAMVEAQAGDPPPALTILANRFGLSGFEQAVLLLCAAMEFDTRIPALCARAQDDANRPFPTFALALALFDEPTWDALSPERPLRHWRLIEINQPGAQPLTTSPSQIDERVVNYLKGLNYVDDRLSPLLVPFDAASPGLELPPSQQRAVDVAVR